MTISITTNGRTITTNDLTPEGQVDFRDLSFAASLTLSSCGKNEIKSAMKSFTQATRKGYFDREAIRVLKESAPMFTRALSIELGGIKGVNLREYAEEGKITNEVVFNVLDKRGEEWITTLGDMQERERKSYYTGALLMALGMFIGIAMSVAIGV